jgi:hypothetical protein
VALNRWTPCAARNEKSASGRSGIGQWPASPIVVIVPRASSRTRNQLPGRYGSSFNGYSHIEAYSARRLFYGPGEDNWDIALLKDTHLTESKVLEFRMETSNTFNHPQFFGANSVDGNINDSTFGRVISAMAPRLVQVSLKFRF